MFHPEVVAARVADASARYAEALAAVRSQIVYRPHDECWAMRDQLADALDAKGEFTRALTPAEDAFLVSERLLNALDFRYFAERYAIVAKETSEAEPLFPLWASQTLFLDRLADIEHARTFGGHPDGILVNCLKARQLGLSTLIEVILAHSVVARRSIRGLVAADVPDQSSYLLSMAERVIDHLPWWLRPPRAAPTNIGTIVSFATGSSLRVAAGKSQRGGLQDRGGSKGNIGRGKTWNRVHLSELSTWERPEQIDDGLMPGVPMRPEVFVAFESTAKGRYDWWHKHWDAAAKGTSRFTNVFIPWYIEPEKYWLPTPEGWEPNETTKAHAAVVEQTSPTYLLGKTVRLNREQLYWYEASYQRWDDADQLNKFHEEYPACVTAETKVSTTRGILPIPEVRVGDITESGRIVACGPQPISPVYRLETVGGRVLRGTADHPVMTAEGVFVWLARLRPGDTVQLCPPRFSEIAYVQRWGRAPSVRCELLVDPPWGRFLGYFMGDGCWHADTLSVMCDGKDVDVIDEVARTVHILFGNPPRRRTISRVKGRKGAVELRLGCLSAREALNQLGLLKTNGSGGWKRRVCVPDAIWRSPKPIVREFLSALFECDGSASGGVVSWGSSSVDFARDVQLLLLGFGIPVNLSANPKVNGRGTPYVFYRLLFGREATTKFAREIGFRGARKRALCVPHSRRHPKSRAGIGRAARPLTLTDAVRVVTLEGPVEVTYDVTVEGTHVFSANGILTHNTAEEAFQHAGRSIFRAKVLDRLRGIAKPPIDIIEVLPAKDIAQLQAWEREQARDAGVGT